MIHTEKKRRCFALFSGGLDSMLAVRYMMQLGYDVLPIFFQTPFFGPAKALTAANHIGVELIVYDITPEHLEMLQHPRYGYGKGMNPCIDCHGLMFRMTASLMQEYKVDFLISGEVLAQRPMSQRHDAMNSVAKLSSVKDLLVRPLCQKLLTDTLPIREGWVNKADMLDIQGRGRQRQMALAKELGITEYENAGGGCMLTEKIYSLRLKDLVIHKQFSLENIEFLALARHYRLSPNCKLILGRDYEENERLIAMVTDEIVMKSPEHPGPLGVLSCQKPPEEKELQVAASMLLRYVKAIQTEGDVQWGQKEAMNSVVKVPKMAPEIVEKYLIM